MSRSQEVKSEALDSIRVPFAPFEPLSSIRQALAPDFVLPRQEPPKKGESVTEGPSMVDQRKGRSVTEGLSDDEKDIIRENNLIAFAYPKAPDFVLPRQEPPKKGESVIEGMADQRKDRSVTEGMADQRKDRSVTEGLSNNEKDIIRENLIAFIDPKAPDFVLPRQDPQERWKCHIRSK
nr:hypothetical protein [Tanacetum cinerariifolium]